MIKTPEKDDDKTTEKYDDKTTEKVLRFCREKLTPSPHVASYTFLLFGGFFCKADKKSQKRLKR